MNSRFLGKKTKFNVHDKEEKKEKQEEKKEKEEQEDEEDDDDEEQEEDDDDEGQEEDDDDEKKEEDDDDEKKEEDDDDEEKEEEGNEKINWEMYELKKEQFEPIEKKFEDSMNDLNKKKAINKIIQKNNINPNIIKLFLQNNLQTKKNFDYLKEALTSKQYKSLYKNKRRSNPFETILLFFDNLIKNKSNNSLMKNASFIGYNIPFIYGIERVRMNYYLYLLKDKNIQFSKSFINDLLSFQNFFNYLKTLNSEEECDKNEINMIFYQFILEITQVIYNKRINVIKIPTIYNKVNPNFIEYKDYKKNSLIVKEEDSYLKKRDNFNYIVSNGIETKNINEKNYNLELLADDLINYTSYPLNLLLYRNESINYYYSQGKNFMEREGDSLFKQFKKYFLNLSNQMFVWKFYQNQNIKI